jgi:GNAT superfamily N-acetyltransferase
LKKESAMTTSELPNGYYARAPTTDDLDELAALLVAHDQARFGKAEWAAPAAREWIASVWATPGFDVRRDAQIVLASTGAIAAYATLWRPDDASGFFVASPRLEPRYQPLDLDAFLLRWAEPLARQRAAALPSGVTAALNSWVNGPDQPAEDMLAREGFTLEQRYLRMEITMQAPPPAPAWPAGITARPFVAGRDERAIFDLMQAAFAEGDDSYTLNFEEWSREIFTPESNNPSLWTLADSGEGLAGAVISRLDAGGHAGAIGWLEDVGVQLAWRQRGLGLAMLYHSFGVFYQRGVVRCGLTVDAQNASGAARLYERAGMAAKLRQEIRYAKPLR